MTRLVKHSETFFSFHHTKSNRISTIGHSICLIIVCFLITANLISAQMVNGESADKSFEPYFQQTVNTTIDVSLDDVKHRLDGTISMDYINNSPDVLDTIFIHLWANAYKDRTTAFAKQQLRNKSTKFHYAQDSSRGNFEALDFKVDGQSVQHQYFENNPDIVFIILPESLRPAGQVTISTPLKLKIPASFSRLGHGGTSYQMTQWFPKPAVYDRDGWHPMPYLNQGEFYSEFGSYDVTITLPENYVVASTGVLQNESEILFLEEKMKETKARAQDSIRDNSFPESSSKMKTIRYLAENVHDFGWFADKRFYVEKGQVTLSNGKYVDTYVFYTDTEKSMWQDALGYVDRSVKFYSEKVGNYPYPHATAVQSALSAGGGMEYPMITVIGAMGQPQALDGVITHEVGHNWFYGILGFNERDHPWLDEGLNSYYDHRYDQLYYDAPMTMGLPERIVGNLPTSAMQFILRAQMKRGHAQDPSLHSAEFSNINYFLGCYEKPALAFEFLEQYLGVERFDKIMHSLYDKWEFKHPGPDDVIAHFNKESGEDLSWFFDGFIYSSDEVNYKISNIKQEGENYKIKIKNTGDVNAPFPITAYKKGTAVETKWYDSVESSNVVDFPNGDYDYFVVDSSYTMLDWNMDNNYKKSKGINMPKIGYATGFDRMDKKQLYLLPALGYNVNDGFMAGLHLNNLSLPYPRLKFVANTMYGFNSQKIVGTALLQYDQVVHKGALQRVSYKIGSKQFSLSENRIDETRADYGTITPSVAFHLVHGEGSLWTSKIELKNTFVRISNFEAGLENGGVTSDNIYTKASYDIQHASVLAPFKASFSAEYANYENVFPEERLQSVRLDLEAKQTYAFMKKKNLSVRFYGAVFPYTEFDNTTGNNASYGGVNNNINLIHTADADHAFEDYFFGRDRQGGVNANQVGQRFGAFKVAGQDVSANHLGQSDQAAFAVNLVTDIPIKRIPSLFKLYFDYGGYMSNRQTSIGHEFETIYRGGIMFNGLDFVNVYFPIFQSENIRVAQPGNYFSRVSFTFDLNKLNLIDLYNNYRI